MYSMNVSHHTSSTSSVMLSSMAGRGGRSDSRRVNCSFFVKKLFLGNLTCVTSEIQLMQCCTCVAY